MLPDHSELVEAICLYELENVLVRGFGQQLVVKFVFVTGLAFLVHYGNVDQLLNGLNGASDVLLNVVVIEEPEIFARHVLDKRIKLVLCSVPVHVVDEATHQLVHRGGHKTGLHIL